MNILELFEVAVVLTMLTNLAGEMDSRPWNQDLLR